MKTKFTEEQKQVLLEAERICKNEERKQNKEKSRFYIQRHYIKKLLKSQIHSEFAKKAAEAGLTLETLEEDDINDE